MKNLFLLIFLFLFFKSSYSQFPITQSIGGPNTLVSVPANGGFRASLVNRNFADTTAANATEIDAYPGAQIFTTGNNTLWVRNATATGWVMEGGGSSPTGNFWNLTGNLFPVVVADYGVGTNDATNLPFKTNNIQRVILPSTGLARQGDAAWQTMVFDTTNKTWGYGNRNLRQTLTAGNLAFTGHQFFVGDSAGYLIPKRLGSDSSNSVMIGDHAGYGGDGVVWSVFMGYRAGYLATDAFNSNFLGGEAGYLAEAAAYSNFLGWRAGYGATDADNSQFFGALAGFEAESASLSDFIGDESGYQATNASNSLFMLYRAGYQATNAAESHFIGRESGYQATNAIGSNFIGLRSGRSATGATFSNFFGFWAGHQASNASYSNLLGFQVGMNFTGNNIGSNNIIIGTNISLPNASANMINIGGVIFAINTYATTTGNPRVTPTATGMVGLGTNSPSSTLDLVGTFQYTDGNQQNGYVLTSDGSGNATWQAAAGGGTTWNAILDPTGNQSLTFGDAELTTWANGSNTETFLTITSNSLTTGTVISSTSSSLTSGNLLNLVSTSTALASGNELLNISMSGANGTNGITATGARVSVTNTGTTSSNYGYVSSVSGGATLNVGAQLTGTGGATSIGGDFTAGGSTSNNYGVRINVSSEAASNGYGILVADVSGAGTNYGIIVTGDIKNGFGNTAPAEVIAIGTAGSVQATMSMSGGTSGKIILTTAAAAGTYTLTLPTNDGDASQFLQTNGSGVLSWATATGGVSVTGTPVDDQIAVWTSASAIEGTSSLTFTSGILVQTGSSASQVGFAMRNTDASGRARFALGNDNSDIAGLFFINGTSKTDYGGAGSVNTVNINNAAISFHTNNNDVSRLYISGAGNIGLGTESPTMQLQLTSGRLGLYQGADVASAAGAIALGGDGNSFEITGTSAITLISNTNWQNGSIVTLLFTSTASLTDGTVNSGTDIGMELAGNANFTGSAGATLSLILSEIGGTQRWREVSRSVQ